MITNGDRSMSSDWYPTLRFCQAKNGLDYKKKNSKFIMINQCNRILKIYISQHTSYFKINHIFSTC